MKNLKLVAVVACLAALAGCSSLCAGNRAGSPVFPYTGLIIDARGTGLQASMTPKIMADSQIVYEACEKETAVREGIAGFAFSLRQAVNDKKSGENPLVVRAKGTDTSLKNALISGRDAELISAANRSARFLDKCNVVVILDKKN